MYEKQQYVFNLIFATLFSSPSIDEINSEDEARLSAEFLAYTEQFKKQIWFINYINEQQEDGFDRDPMKNIIDMMNDSMNDEKLGRMPLPWNPWF